MSTSTLGLAVTAAVLAATPALAKSAASPRAPFDAAAFDWSRASGTNTVKGEAMLRTQGGDVKTCAGLGVEVIPSTPYTDDWVQWAFGSTIKGRYFEPLFGKSRAITPEAVPFLRQKRCSIQGQFAFDGLPDGTYYLVATVTWDAVTRYGRSQQGGDLLQRVEVRGGETKELLVTE